MSKYVCPYLSELDDSICHSERVINGSAINTEWWKHYRADLLRRMLRHQLLEFDYFN